MRSLFERAVAWVLFIVGCLALAAAFHAGYILATDPDFFDWAKAFRQGPLIFAKTLVQFAGAWLTGFHISIAYLSYDFPPAWPHILLFAIGFFAFTRKPQA